MKLREAIDNLGFHLTDSSQNNLLDFSSGDGDLWPDSWQKAVDGTAVGNTMNDLWTGLKNRWYKWTGQDEKTSTYIHEEQREDTKNQRTAADMAAAGLSKYGLSGATSGNATHSSEPSDGLQRIAALLDLKRANAEIDNVQSNTNKTNAEASNIVVDTKNKEQAYVLNELRYELDYSKAQAEIALSNSNTQLNSQKIVSEIQDRSIQAAQHAMDMVSQELSNALKSKDLEYYDVEHQEALSLSEAQRAQIAQSIQKYVQDIVKSQAEVEHLSYQDQLLLEDLAYRQLEFEVMAYNLSYSAEFGLRTTDQSSKIAGINTSQVAKGVMAILEQIRSQRSLGEQISYTFGSHSSTPSAAGGGGGSAW